MITVEALIAIVAGCLCLAIVLTTVGLVRANRRRVRIDPYTEAFGEMPRLDERKP